MEVVCYTLSCCAFSVCRRLVLSPYVLHSKTYVYLNLSHASCGNKKVLACTANNEAVVLRIYAVLECFKGSTD